MNNVKKLEILGESAQYDRCNYINPSVESFLKGKIPGVYNASTSNGCKVPLLKVLMTNKCSNDCRYCINHNKHQFNRVEFSPEELASLFIDYYQNRYVEGLFLSSGIPNDAENSMENMVEVIRKLRLDYGYKGYIHLKILPGSSYDLIKRAVSLADRVSVNIEAATPEGLSELSSTKKYDTDILRRINWIKRLIKKDKTLAPSGQTTQFIVGATDETDQQILERVNWLYKKMDIKRSYFSTFEPMKNTPLEFHEEPSHQRSPRLYQADYLLNSYGFNLDELVFDENDNLKLDADPKYYSALSHKELFPVEINDAPYKELLRVPGIGKISAARIIRDRKLGNSFKKLEDLKKIGVITNRAEPFIKLNNKYQSTLEF
ncbi:MAG: putative DNA modification/repair radical SAM protein [Methanobacterium sp.]